MDDGFDGRARFLCEDAESSGVAESLSHSALHLVRMESRPSTVLQAAILEPHNSLNSVLGHTASREVTESKSWLGDEAGDSYVELLLSEESGEDGKWEEDSEVLGDEIGESL